MATQDKKHWSSQSEAARDEVRDALEQTIAWVLAHKREAAWGAGGAAAAIILGALFFYGRQARADAAWDKLSQAELYAYSGRPQEAETLASQVAEERGSAAASALAEILQGDLHYPRGEYDKALSAYDKAVQDAPEPLKPYAAAERIMTLEAAGKAAECAAAAQSFLDAHADHLMAAQIHAALARCQLAQGQTDAAKATLQRVTLQYPGTPSAEWAGFRLQALQK